MARALHLVKGSHLDLARATIERQLAAGDDVTVAVLPGATAPDLPAGARVAHVPAQLGWPALLDLVFEADHVLTW